MQFYVPKTLISGKRDSIIRMSYINKHIVNGPIYTYTCLNDFIKIPIALVDADLLSDLLQAWGKELGYKAVNYHFKDRGEPAYQPCVYKL